MDGSTTLVGLIGDPVEHSLSPVMHNAAFDALRMNWRYVPLRVAQERLGDAVRGLRALGFRGANVTVPHKEAVLAHVDEVADETAKLGAVNTLVVRDVAGRRRVDGHNTDVSGFIAALQGSGIDVAGETVVIVGAGGAGRAAASGLLRLRAQEIVLFSRDERRAARAAADLGRGGGRIVARRLDADALVAATRRAALLVHATPVGMSPDVGGSVWPETAPFPRGVSAFDLVYAPDPTRLLSQAAAAGARVVSGLEMLVAQGAQAFALWTGKTAPIDVMRAACYRALGRRLPCDS